MAKKKLVENKALKIGLIAIATSITIIMTSLVAMYMSAVNLSQYIDTRMRCNASSIVTGYETPLRHEKRYYPEGDQGNKGGPGIGDNYFCSNKEAEDAGYQVYTDLRVN